MRSLLPLRRLRRVTAVARIDPADVAIVAAVNDVDPAVGLVAENQHLLSGHSICITASPTVIDGTCLHLGDHNRYQRFGFHVLGLIRGGEDISRDASNSTGDVRSR